MLDIVSRFGLHLGSRSRVEQVLVLCIDESRKETRRSLGLGIGRFFSLEEDSRVIS